MPYFTSEEPVFYYPESMNIVWEEENSGIPSNDNEVTVQSKVYIEPTSSSDQPTIQVTSTSQMM